MEISDLKIFCQVVESGSITSAAQALHRVPSNVTTRIQKLEQQLEQSLFIRENNRLRISPAGEKLLDYSKRILELADEAISQFQDPTPRGELSIGSMEAVAATYLSRYLTHYHQTQAQVALNVKTLPTNGLINQVLQNELDLGFVANAAEHKDLNRHPVTKEKLILVSGLSQPSLKNLAGPIKLLGFNEGCYYRKTIIQWANEQDILYSVTAIQSYHALLNCVAAGMGVGIVPQSLLDLYPHKKTILSHPLPAHLRTTQTHLIWRKNNSKPSVMAFVEMVKSKQIDIKNLKG